MLREYILCTFIAMASSVHFITITTLMSSKSSSSIQISLLKVSAGSTTSSLQNLQHENATLFLETFWNSRRLRGEILRNTDEKFTLCQIFKLVKWHEMESTFFKVSINYNLSPLGVQKQLSKWQRKYMERKMTSWLTVNNGRTQLKTKIMMGPPLTNLLLSNQITDCHKLRRSMKLRFLPLMS